MKRFFSLFLILASLVAVPVFADTVPRMDKDELKAMLGSNDLVILDVRRGRDWSTSEFKIKDALRIEDGNLSEVKDYPKDKTFVLYCA